MRTAIVVLAVMSAATGSADQKSRPSPRLTDPNGAQSKSDWTLPAPSVFAYYLQRYPLLEATIRAHIRPDGPVIEDGMPITSHHLRNLDCLSIREQTIPSFSTFRVLRSLRVYSCRIEDLSSIERLSCTEELHLRDCGIRDTSAFAKVKVAEAAMIPPRPPGPPRKVPWSVKYLSLSNNEIEDITSLADCEDLEWLDLRDNKVHRLSALKALHKLTCVDVRDNPLASEADADILAIKANNPGVQILAGQEPRVGKEDLREQLSARAKISEFTRCTRFRYEDGIGAAMLVGVTNGDEDLPGEISKALACLARGQDKEYLPDLAAVFIKYLIELEEWFPPGPVWDPNAPLVKAFCVGAGMKGTYEEGLPAMVLGHWILNHRDKLAPSVFLDVQIEKYREAHQRLVRKGRFSG